VLLTTIEVGRFEPLVRRAGLAADWQVALRDGARQRIAGDADLAAGLAEVNGSGHGRGVEQPLTQAGWRVLVQPAALGQDSVLRRAALALAAAIGAATVAGVVAGSVGGARLSAAVTALASPADGAAVPLRIREIDSARAALQDMAAERQRTLHVLQEVHERFATVFDSAPVAMAVGPGRCRMPASPR